MADESVYMDVPFVENMAKQFQQFGETCNSIEKVVDAAINALNVINLFGFGAATFAIQILNTLKNALKQAAAKMLQLSADVTSAKNAFVEGDTTGSRHFV